MPRALSKKVPPIIRVWLIPFTALASLSVILISFSSLVDWLAQDFFEHYLPVSSEAIAPIPEVVAGVLGIAITVVAIIVELAAQRYTSRVVDLFIGDKTNFVVLGFFVISCVFTLWMMRLDTDDYTPHFGLLLSLVLMTVSLLILVPYFNHIFEFLAPKNIIQKIRNQISTAIRREIETQSTDPEHLAGVKGEVARAAEQISDIALNSINQQDRTLAMDCIVTLKLVAIDYLEVKSKLPDAWFAMNREDRDDPDYVSLSAEGLREIETSNTWFEHKIFKQMHLVFGTSLNNLRDLNNLIGMCLRDVAFRAVELEDRRVRWLVIKFFNTLFRTTINNRDVRTAYNLFAQYRLLGEKLLDANQLFIVEQVFNYFKYYGQLADGSGLGFLLETVAYDLYRLCRMAHERKARNFDSLLRIFLDVDRPPDLLEKEDHLLGVRKAQCMLGSYFLATGHQNLAKRIVDDVCSEPLPRLRSIKADILKAERNFWEITDRGTNFDYLEPEYRLGFHNFFRQLEDEVIEYHKRRKEARRRAREARAKLAAAPVEDSEELPPSSAIHVAVGPDGEPLEAAPPKRPRSGPRTSEEVMAEVARVRDRLERERREKASAAGEAAEEAPKTEPSSPKRSKRSSPRSAEEVMAEVAKLRERMGRNQKLQSDRLPVAKVENDAEPDEPGGPGGPAGAKRPDSDSDEKKVAPISGEHPAAGRD